MSAWALGLQEANPGRPMRGDGGSIGQGGGAVKRGLAVACRAGYSAAMNATHFRVTYDGPALASHAMDVRELAPALLAAGDLLEAATRVLHGDRVKPQTNVRASFKTGSFGIDFALATDWLLKVRDIFAGDTASAAANAIEILVALGLVTGAGGHGLVSVLKWLRGRKLAKVETVAGKIRLTVDSDTLEIEREVLALLRDMGVREALDKLLSPLDCDGIDTFASGTDEVVTETIGAAERAWFRTPEIADDLILDDTRKMAFSIVSLAFRDDNKWRLNDGSATIHATFSDLAFIARVDQNIERFAKGDLLICLVRVRQWQTASGARTDYDVTEVLEHRQAARKLPLPMTGADPGTGA